jgi:hypothetical protein
VTTIPVGSSSDGPSKKIRINLQLALNIFNRIILCYN